MRGSVGGETVNWPVELTWFLLGVGTIPAVLVAMFLVLACIDGVCLALEPRNIAMCLVCGRTFVGGRALGTWCRIKWHTALRCEVRGRKREPWIEAQRNQMNVQESE